MGSGWHEWPLMIFTVFGQCVAGGFIVLALALLKGDLRAEAQQRVIATFGLWVLMGIGFIAFMLHSGSPMRAFNSLNRVGASALSNEIASGSILFCRRRYRLVAGNAEKAVTGIAYAMAGGDDGSWRRLCLDDGACV